MKKTISNILILLIVAMSSSLFFSCEKEDNSPEIKDETPNDSINNNTGLMIFTCEIDGEPFEATTIVTQATSGIITAKGLKVSNGASPVEGSIQMTLSFGTNQQGVLGVGTHQMIGSRFETVNSPNNQNLAIFKDVKINGLTSNAAEGGQVNVEKYYEESYWQGAKGTFNNIKIYTFEYIDNDPMPIVDSVILTNGIFDVQYTY